MIFGHRIMRHCAAPPRALESRAMASGTRQLRRGVNCVPRGSEPVKQRPGMYTRTTTRCTSLEVLDNAADEAPRLRQEDQGHVARRWLVGVETTVAAFHPACIRKKSAGGRTGVHAPHGRGQVRQRFPAAPSSGGLHGGCVRDHPLKRLEVTSYREGSVAQIVCRRRRRRETQIAPAGAPAPPTATDRATASRAYHGARGLTPR